MCLSNSVASEGRYERIQGAGNRVCHPCFQLYYERKHRHARVLSFAGHDQGAGRVCVCHRPRRRSSGRGFAGNTTRHRSVYERRAVKSDRRADPDATPQRRARQHHPRGLDRPHDVFSGRRGFQLPLPPEPLVLEISGNVQYSFDEGYVMGRNVFIPHKTFALEVEG